MKITRKMKEMILWETIKARIFKINLTNYLLLTSHPLPRNMTSSSIILGFLLCLIPYFPIILGESLNCVAVYREGGAAAVLQSPKCPRWKLSTTEEAEEYKTTNSRSASSARCQLAMHQGRRLTQEDRILCALDIHIPFPGPMGVTGVKVGKVAVFDGHNGIEASEAASKLLLEYFMVHTYFLLDTAFSLLWREGMGRLAKKGQQDLLDQKITDKELGHYALDLERFKIAMSSVYDSSFHLKILKEALLSAIRDIDMAFSREAMRNNINSGSTATVILMAHGQILVAHIGDSKAFLCSEVSISTGDIGGTLARIFRDERLKGSFPPLRDYRTLKKAVSSRRTFLIPKELTRDHHPDRDDERARVESAGGHVSEWGGVARVNGQLAVSRALGDVHFKSYGVISMPELADWKPLLDNDSYLVVASDGILEKLSMGDVCELLWFSHDEVILGSHKTPSSPNSLADCIVRTAIERGTTDNMAIAVIPISSSNVSEPPVGEGFDALGQPNYTALENQEGINEELADKSASKTLQMEENHPDVNFDRFLVEGDSSRSGYFYLSENLNEDDHTLKVLDHEELLFHNLNIALPSGVAQSYGGPMNLYGHQNMCLNLGVQSGGIKEHCINPDIFAKFVALLESIPLHISGLDDQTVSGSRYKLKKRYDRGAYGEVWLAFHWNNSHLSDDSQWNFRRNLSFYKQPGVDEGYSEAPSSADESRESPSEGRMFILKRIMVEKGAAIYLSGLREKYFCEIFLNATASLGVLLSPDILDSFSEQSSYLNCVSHVNKSANHVKGEAISTNSIKEERKLLRTDNEEGLDHIARYVESFESRSKEIWLVFHHEGVSLSKLLYTAAERVNDSDEERNEDVNHIQMLYPSKWWHWVKKTEAGQEEMRNLVQQLLMALKSCHGRNITHRDIKPENMVVCFEDQVSGQCLKGPPSEEKDYKTKMRIIDFGSAVDEFTLKHLYGTVGPSRAEQTYEYSPPEAFLNASWYQGSISTTMKYDMWSVGVVFLELILGTPNVFQINSKTRALLDPHLDGWNESLRELAYRLRSLMEMCILIPGVKSKPHQWRQSGDQGPVSPASWRCSEEFFAQQIKSIDPLNIGFPNVWALRLVRELLRWHPEDRLNVDDALKHPYFSSPS